jgi:hypothetical protein
MKRREIRDIQDLSDIKKFHADETDESHHLFGMGGLDINSIVPPMATSSNPIHFGVLRQIRTIIDSRMNSIYLPNEQRYNELLHQLHIILSDNGY